MPNEPTKKDFEDAWSKTFETFKWPKQPISWADLDKVNQEKYYFVDPFESPTTQSPQLNEEEEIMPIEEETLKNIKESVASIWENGMARVGPTGRREIAFIHYVGPGIAEIKYHRNRKRVKAPLDPILGTFVPSTAEETNPKKIITHSGTMYPTSEIYMFHYLLGLGWVHCYEVADIANYYRMSSLTNRWYHSKRSCFVAYQSPMDADGDCGECEESEIVNLPAYSFNKETGLGKVYYALGDGRYIYDGDNNQVEVSRYHAVNYAKKCDWSDRRYYGALVKQVRNSEKYKCVSIHYIGDGKPFRGCESCGHVFESNKLVEFDPGAQGTPIMCVKCYSQKTAVPSVIQPHNGKKYPKPYYDFTERLGSEVIDGELFATCKKSKYQEPRLFGVEIEAEFDRPSMKKIGLNRFKIAAEILKFFSDFVAVKEDGSLTMNGKYNDCNPDAGYNYAGLEIVTAPSGLKRQKAMWTKFPDFAYYKFFRAWDTDTCGFHVHISKASLTSLQIGRMLRFVNHKNNKKFIEIVAGRSEKKFTKYYPKNLSDALYPERVNNPDEGTDHDRQRRVALNIANEHTVEFRIFRGTVNAHHIIRNIEFCEAVCNFCYPASRSFAELDHPKYFVGWIESERKTYPEFARWMAHHGLIKSRVIKDKKAAAPEEGEDKTNEPVLSGPGTVIAFGEDGAPIVNGKVVDKKKAVLKEESKIPEPTHPVLKKKAKQVLGDPFENPFAKAKPAPWPKPGNTPAPAKKATLQEEEEVMVKAIEQSENDAIENF